MPTPRQTQQARQSSVARQRFSQTLLLATDLQQSVLAELDRTNPNRFAYSPYGSQSGPRQAGTHLGFNGQLRERSTGWYHLGNGHRVYNPVLMRFHSADRLSPFGEGGINAYAYCSCSPINRVDPTGRSWLALLGQAVGAGLNFIFAGAAINRAASAIVTGNVPKMITRVGNSGSFWGGVLGAPSRLVDVPAGIVAPMPTGRSLGSNVGTIVSQVLTGGGAVAQNSAMAKTWMTAATKAGQSRWRVLWEATKEASGWNLLRRQEPWKMPKPSDSIIPSDASGARSATQPAADAHQIRSV